MSALIASEGECAALGTRSDDFRSIVAKATEVATTPAHNAPGGDDLGVSPTGNAPLEETAQI